MARAHEPIPSRFNHVPLGNGAGHGISDMRALVQLNNSQIAEECDILTDVLEIPFVRIVCKSVKRGSVRTPRIASTLTKETPVRLEMVFSAFTA